MSLRMKASTSFTRNNDMGGRNDANSPHDLENKRGKKEKRR